jgi:hypothetical protein
MRPKFIKYVEKKEQIFLSEVRIDDELDLKKINDKNFTLLYITSEYVKNKVEWTKKIYKTNHPFYLFFERDMLYEDKGHLTIFHEPNKINELNFFLKQVINTLKNKN